MTTEQMTRPRSSNKMKECVICSGPLWAGDKNERLAGGYSHPICYTYAMEEAHKEGKN